MLIRIAILFAIGLSVGCGQSRAPATCGVLCGNPTDGGGNDAGEDFVLSWPIEGLEGHDWVINNYVDLDEEEGKLADYHGSVQDDAKTYDGHRGTDIDIAHFRRMEEGVKVLAAFPGTVVAVTDIHDDRSIEWFDGCADFTNAIQVRHANGYLTKYLHIKRDSALVEVGESVKTGDALALVGSAGCSTWPHLHFEVRDPSDHVVDPFQSELWANSPVYNTLLGLMDIVITQGELTSVDELRDPAANVTSVLATDTLGVGALVAGGGAGDTVSIVLQRPDTSTYTTRSVNYEQVYRFAKWYWNIELEAIPGTWNGIVNLNDDTVTTFELNVVAD